jgi:hypothetical protein
MKPYLVREDIEQWDSLTQWLERRAAGGLAPEAVQSALAETAIAEPTGMS